MLAVVYQKVAMENCIEFFPSFLCLKEYLFFSAGEKIIYGDPFLWKYGRICFYIEINDLKNIMSNTVDGSDFYIRIWNEHNCNHPWSILISVLFLFKDFSKANKKFSFFPYTQHIKFKWIQFSMNVKADNLKGRLRYSKWNVGNSMPRSWKSKWKVENSFHFSTHQKSSKCFTVWPCRKVDITRWYMS